MTTKRHVATIKRPASALGSRGQRAPQDPANDTTVAADVLYSREPLRGRELEIARQVDAQMTERARFYVDPSWSLSSDDYLVDQTTSEIMNIGDIVYEQGVQVEAICSIGRAA